jgi:hypothetical protein
MLFIIIGIIFDAYMIYRFNEISVDFKENNFDAYDPETHRIY